MFYWLDKLKPKTKTKTKSKIFFVGVNENLTTSLYTFDQGGRENIFLQEEKVFL